MAESLLTEFEQSIEELTLIPSSGGVFEVTVGDELVYSKKATGRHAEAAEVLESVRSVIS
jgi:selenoprotein W-related protein